MTAQIWCFGESGNAYKAALTMELAGYDWQPIYVDFFNGEARSPEFRALNEMGEVEDRDFVGLWATSVQHQIDHLNGKVYVDHLTPLRRKMLVAKSGKLARRG